MKGLLLALLLVLAPTPALAQSSPTVRTENGMAQGIVLKAGVRAWLGIPFAAPPVRDLRWKAPQRASDWTGVFHADRYAPMCLQALRGRTMNHYFGNEAISEDCLYLNVWAPQRGTKRPVIVWIYGGGFNVGSASMANYSGEGLARDGVVRVNLAYRVGPMGFLAHPDLTKESGYGGSGNYGLMDQIAGLKWVQRNIEAFGGDPGNVTIVGQSAGSMSVALLQTSPEARGLFHRIVGMSGSPFGDMAAPAQLRTAEEEGLGLQAAIGAASIQEMRDVGGDRILAAAAPRSAIVMDGKYITGAPSDIFAARRQNDVPIMIGFTRDESFRPLGPVASVAQFQAAVERQFPANAAAIIAAYPASDAGEAARAASDVARDASVGLQMQGWAAAQRAFGSAPAYVYLFARRQPYTPGVSFIDHDPATVGAYHTGDVPYWLRTRDALNLFRQTRSWQPGDQELEDVMSGLLVSFATTGRPSSQALLEWPSFVPDAPRIAWLAEAVRLIDWPNFQTLALLRAPAPAQAARPLGAASARIRD